VTQTADIICTYFTLAGNVGPFDANTASPIALAERAEAAGRAGYTGFGFGVDDIKQLSNTLGYQEINATLDNNGLKHRELEVLVDWFVTDGRRIAADRKRQILLEAAEKIGARHIKVAGDVQGNTYPLEYIIEEFSRLCNQAAAAGSAITIELFPGSNLADLQTGRAVVEGARCSNGGLLLDIWHMVRGNIHMDAIAALPPGIINHIELDDGALLPAASYLDDTINSRLLPGDGEFPLQAFLAAVAATGYDGLYGVEILSKCFRTMPLTQAARDSYQATAALFK
jgi:sugar phosphate isomerase/epimerase